MRVRKRRNGMLLFGYTAVMVGRETALSVTHLLDEICGASTAAMMAARSSTAIPVDLKNALENVRNLVRELLELQAQHQEEVKRLYPHFRLEKQWAVEAVLDIRTVFEVCNRPDLDKLAREVNELLRSLDVPSCPD